LKTNCLENIIWKKKTTSFAIDLKNENKTQGKVL